MMDFKCSLFCQSFLSIVPGSKSIIHSGEGPGIEMSAFEFYYGGKFTAKKPNS